ncbi:MAG: hypothetical protein KTR24_05460 [Saprospiraceae bacterium]|nr:hypothetical protein [Saprospiraceae bacterium]
MQFLRFLTLLFLVVDCTDLRAQSFLFDFGNQTGKEGLPDHVACETCLGFTWIDSPNNSLIWSDRYSFRKAEERTGVQDSVLHFRISPPAGSYVVYLHMDAGYEDTLTTQVTINDALTQSQIQVFKRPAEPYEKVKSQFRIWRHEWSHEGGNMQIMLKGPHHEVRLLALHLVRKDRPREQYDPYGMDLLQEAGRYQNHAQGLEIIEDLLQDPAYAVPEHFIHELSYLVRAEALFAKSGYEWARKQDGLTLIQRSQQIAMLLDPLVEDQNHPLFERACWLQSKVLYHLDLEYESPAESRTAQKGFRELLKRYPDDTILQMYAGKLFYSKPSIDSSAAPEWAKWQQTAMTQLRKLVSYWVTQRQELNGEFGGKLGDDVEALRFWGPLVYTGDSLAIEGWSRLFQGVWHSNHIYQGYARNVSDVEHASEFISDTEPLMMLISEDTAIHQRALHLAHHFDTLWSAQTASGDRLFKGAWYSSTSMDERPPRNRDVDYNARAMKVLRYYLFRYPDDTYVRGLLTEWARAWLRHAQSQVKGKPPGILPPSIRADDDQITGDEPNWWKSNMFWDYFDFNGSALIMDHMHFMSQFEANDSLLTPLLRTLDLVNQETDVGAISVPGSLSWVAAQYRSNRHWWSLVQQWRSESTDTQYDALLRGRQSSYLDFCITGNPSGLADGLKELTQALSTNWPMMTSECIFTDRIYGHYQDGLRRIETNILKAMLTGEQILWGTSPYLKVSWKNLPHDLSVLVRPTREFIEIHFYNHSDKKISTEAVFWHLQEGEHELNVDDQIHQEPITVTNDVRQHRYLTIPPGKHVYSIEL